LLKLPNPPIGTDGKAHPEGGSGDPERADLTGLCAELNRLNARYVVDGFAIIQAGYVRLTSDIDLLVENLPSPNVYIMLRRETYSPRRYPSAFIGE